MKSLPIILSSILLIGFTALGVNNLVKIDNKLQFRDIELKSKSTKLKELNLEYNQLNDKLDKADALSDEQLKELQIERQRLEEKKRKAEAELQAKAEAKKREDEAIAKASEEALNKVTGTQTAYASSGGTKEQWMSAAGIPQSDWQYVDCVINGCNGVSPEGGWNGVQRWNTTGSGAYGLCQSLPASKMASAGSDYMTNPITQLKWCHQYAQGYGGWAQAWQFRQCVGSCYSARTGGYVSKDHTWW